MPMPTPLKHAFVFTLTLTLLIGLGHNLASGNYPNHQSLLSPLDTPDFAISAGPDTLTIPLGTTATSTITLTSLGGFSGSIFLSTSSSVLDASLNLTEVNLSAGETATATLSILAPSSTAPRDYTLSVGGSYGCGLVHNAQVIATVTG